MDDTEIALKKIAKGAGIFSIGLVIVKALGYLYRLIVARLGAEQYGLFSIALGVFSLLIIFCLMGLGEGIVRFISFYKGKSDERRVKGVITSTLKITLVLSIIFAFSLFTLSNWVAVTFFHNADLSLLFKVFAFALPLDALRSIFIGAFKAFQKVEYEVYAKSIAENLTKVILTFIIIYMGFGVVGAAIAYVLSIFISFVLSFYFLEKKVFPVLKTKIVSIKNNKELIVYSFPLLFTGFAISIIQWTDTLMLGHFRTLAEVGIYNVAWPTCTLLYLFPYAIRTLFVPVLSELYAQKKMDIFKDVFKITVKWIVIVESIILIVLVIYSQQIIGILFGAEYVKDKISILGYSFALSAFTLIILSFGRVLGDYLVPARDTLLVVNKTKLIFFNTAICAIINVVLNYILIPVYGLIGAAIASGIAYTVLAVLHTVQIAAITKITPFKSGSIKALAISLVLLVLMIIFKFYTITNIFYIIVSSILVFSVYFVLLLITKTFEKEDVSIVRAMQQKFKINLKLDKIIEKFI